MIQIQLPNTVLELNPLHVISMIAKNTITDLELPAIGKETTYTLEILVRQVTNPIVLSFSGEPPREQIMNHVRHEIDGTNGKRAQSMQVPSRILKDLNLKV